MKKLILVLIAAATVMAAASCGKEKKETADSYLDKLVSGEIEPDVEVADSAVETENTSNNNNITKNDNKENSENNQEKSLENKVDLPYTSEQMGEFVDALDKYESLEILPIDSSDFIIGKQMRLVAVIQDNTITNLYSSEIKSKFTQDSLNMQYIENGQQVNADYIVYTRANDVQTSPAGHQYIYIAYGSEAISSEMTNKAVALVNKVKINESVDMGEGTAESYVLLQETSIPSVYEVFRIEE